MRRRSYTPEFKREAIRLAAERGNMSAVARELGIHASLLRKWKEQLENEDERAFPGRGKPAECVVDCLRGYFSQSRLLW